MQIMAKTHKTLINLSLNMQKYPQVLINVKDVQKNKLNTNKVLEELKKQEKRGEIEIGYLDEMGWDSKPCIPYAWQEEKTTIKLPPIEGKRLNILHVDFIFVS